MLKKMTRLLSLTAIVAGSISFASSVTVSAAPIPVLFLPELPQIAMTAGEVHKVGHRNQRRMRARHSGRRFRGHRNQRRIGARHRGPRFRGQRRFRPRHHGPRFRHRRGGNSYYYGGWWYAAPWWQLPMDVPGPVYYDDSDHVRWCLNRYKSYNPRTDRFLGYDGIYHRCRSPYRR